MSEGGSSVESPGEDVTKQNNDVMSPSDDVTSEIEKVDLDDDIDVTKSPRRGVLLDNPVSTRNVIILLVIIVVVGAVIAGTVGGYYGSKSKQGSTEEERKRNPGENTCRPYTEGGDCTQRYGVWCIGGDTRICTPDPEGWLTWLRRQNGDVTFDRTWEDYVTGFGDPDGDYWLGLDDLHLLTSGSGNFRLRVEMRSWSGDAEWAEYETFVVYNATENYSMQVRRFTGNTSFDALKWVTFTPFSTKDRDNDADAGACAEQHGGGGWWYRDCSHTYPTARYSRQGPAQEVVTWNRAFGDLYVPLKYIRMMVKPSGDSG